MRVLLAGASGLVGGWLLRELRHWWSPSGAVLCREVIVLTRRPLGVERPAGEGRARVREVVVDFDALTERPAEGPWADEAVDHVYCSLGTTIRKAGSQERFQRVDRDYPLALGRMSKAVGASAFGLVSSVGADAGARNFYLRTKGEAEEGLAALGIPRLVIARPSIIGGERDESRPGEWLGKQLARLIPGRYRTVHPAAIAIALARVVSGEASEVGARVSGGGGMGVAASRGGGEVRILESEVIRRLVPPHHVRRALETRAKEG
jgi:uncharacterized protein YbjT (DUF2867 family)